MLQAHQIVAAIAGWPEHGVRTAAGDVRIGAGGATVVERAPRAHQVVDGMRHAVAARYRVDGGRRIALLVGPHDPSSALVVEPQVTYPTPNPLGERRFDQGAGIAVDAAGNAYVAGATGSSNFPTTDGAAQTGFGGSADGFITKLNATGTSLLYSTPDHPPKTILVTSPHPEDGKTSLVTNLAITLAQLGSGEILVIDGDMRRPNLHNILKIPKAPGLSTYLTGQAQLEDVIVATAIPNLSVIPAGRLPVNPSELVASARFKQALETLGQRFAYIVIDTGPLFGVSDGMILAGQVEGVVLVLRQGRASRDAAQRAIRSLMSVRARLLGVILNDVEIGGSRYYGYYDYYANGGSNGHTSAGEGHRDGAEGEPVAGDTSRVS